MKKEKLLSPRMNALWFSYVAIFMFSLAPGFGFKPNLIQILSVSTGWIVFVNGWALYNDRPIMDERKQGLATEAMAWAFVTMALMTVISGSTGIEVDVGLLRDTAEMGLWTWLIVFSTKNLWQRYGG